MARKTVNIELNRVEGDLEFQVDLEGDRVADARCIGTLFRGFEQLLIGRAPKDALVITPRVCGICGTAHLFTTALALERMNDVPVPAHATIIRNLCLMAENVQSDIRQTFLFFAPDLLNPRYADHALAPALEKAFKPLQGSVVLSALDVSRTLVEIVAIFGGQWPHSTYMIPGGVTRPATVSDIIDCREIVDKAVRWFEKEVVGDSLDNWLSLDTAERFLEWVDEPAHRDTALGLFTRFARDQGLHTYGAGTDQFLSAGAHYDPVEWQAPYGEQRTLLAGGVYDGATHKIEAFRPELITEHVRHSWYRPYPDGRHPFEGETVPDYQPESDRYSWAKAPRYDDRVVETGPLAELLTGGDALIVDLLKKEGANTWLRQFARLRRASVLLDLMRAQLKALSQELNNPHYLAPADGSLDDGDGFGFVQAARGTLGHWVQVRNGEITRYQIVTPTAWNASPKDSAGRHGHWEQSVIGLPLTDIDNPIEISHVVRSHDPCLVCTVHFVGAGKKVRYGV
ncbi:nickel-dependent hydrogenase large subunit [Thiosocius teredinicola]|uniref:nickel-dependent hydrogenase large subunit n=1 Tax=Thiosocius teredinicola TaxID=1973002 RepID=UPI000991369F